MRPRPGRCAGAGPESGRKGPAALSLTLTLADVEWLDADPAGFGRHLIQTVQNKRWLHHPRVETYLSERVALFQRVYRR